MGFVGKMLEPAGRAPYLGVVLHHDSVVEHGDAGRLLYRAVRAEARPPEHDVVGLPFASRPASVNQRRVLAVHGGRLAVGIGHVLVRIQHLHLVLAHEEDAAVTPALALAPTGGGCRPLDMQLDVAVAVPREDLPPSRYGQQDAILDNPLGRTAVGRAPHREVSPVKQHDGVGGRRNR